MLGGLLGSGFTHLNLVFARSRKKFMSGIKVIFFLHRSQIFFSETIVLKLYFKIWIFQEFFFNLNENNYFLFKNLEITIASRHKHFLKLHITLLFWQTVLFIKLNLNVLRILKVIAYLDYKRYIKAWNFSKKKF